MAFFSRTSTANLWFLSLKISLISIAAFSIALILKLSFPVISEFLLSAVPGLCASLRSCLTPPYLYFVINGIIIIIAASSRFQHTTDDDPDDDEHHQIDPPAEPRAGVRHDLALAPAEEDYDDVSLKNKTEVPRSPVFGIGDLEDSDEETELLEAQAARDSNEDVVSIARWKEDRTMMSRTDSTEILSEYSLLSPEKPLVSSRFSHRRSVTVNPEGGKSLRVAKRKKQDTLESTWKKITEGRSMPLARHLKKSDTWETHVHHHHQHHQGATDQEPHSMRLKKAEMFSETTTTTPDPPSPLKRSSGNKIKKDPSLGQEELNRRVEAFIKKFNEEMMLQRQESLNQYSEMINRGGAATHDH